MPSRVVRRPRRRRDARGAARRRRHWSLEIAREWILRHHSVARPVLSTTVPSGLRKCIERKFGRWSDFLRSIGVTHSRLNRRWYYWTKATVVAEIRRRKRAGRSLSWRGLDRDGVIALARQGTIRFGTWDAALRAAGVDPDGARENLKWSRERVLELIRARHAAGRSVCRTDVDADDQKLFRTAERLVSTSWLRSVAIAGIDPALARFDRRARVARTTRTRGRGKRHPRR